MKAKRRQELKTNDLAQALDDLGQWFNKWGAYVVGGIAGVVVIIVITQYLSKARAADAANDFVTINNMLPSNPDGSRKSDAEIDRLLDDLDGIAADSGNQQVKAQATMRKGAIALSVAQSSTNGLPMDYVNKASEAFQAVANDPKSPPVYWGEANMHLYEIATMRFLETGDESLKGDAEKRLQAIVKDQRLNGTPLQQFATNALNSIDHAFRRIEFEPQPADAQAQMGPGMGPMPQPTTVQIGGDNGGAVQTITVGGDNSSDNAEEGTSPVTEVPGFAGESSEEGGDEEAQEPDAQ